MNPVEDLLLSHRLIRTFSGDFARPLVGETPEKVWSLSLIHLHSHIQPLRRLSGHHLEFSARLKAAEDRECCGWKQLKRAQSALSGVFVFLSGLNKQTTVVVKRKLPMKPSFATSSLKGKKNLDVKVHSGSSQ